MLCFKLPPGYGITHPGGCAIGARPIDIHIQSMKDLGVEVSEQCRLLSQDEFSLFVNNSLCGSSYQADTDGDRPCNESSFKEAALLEAFIKEKHASSITLKFPSVGATENVLLCAAFSGIEVKLKNAAREPEIAALQNFLNGLGAKIHGAGSSCIFISPCDINFSSGTDLVKEFHFEIPSDRIECGTYLIAGAICGGKLTFHNCSFIEQSSLLRILKKTTDMDNKMKSHTICFQKNPSISDLVVTSPYPGVPTDMQSPLSAFFCTVKGKNYIIESIFRNRASHLDELSKMGAKITRYKNCFIIEGQTCLYGCKVESKDLRGGASLLLAGLGAEGTTEVLDNSYITRGYSDIEAKLSSLGADITKRSCPIK